MWGFQPIFGSYLLVTLLASGMLLLLRIGPSGLSGSLAAYRRYLIWLRAGCFLAVIAAMLRPSIVRVEERVEPSRLVILLDQSRSMTVTDQGDLSRWQAVVTAVQSVQPALKAAADILDVQAYTFDASASRLGDDWVTDLPKEPDGEQTDISGSLDDVLRETGAQRLAGVVLITDGAQRVTVPRVSWQEPARELARRGVPLYTIAVGRGRDESQARDVAVASLPDQFSVFSGNELVVRGSIRIQGYAGRTIPADFIVEDETGKRVHEARQNVRMDDDQVYRDVEFRYVPTEPGEYRLRVRAVVQPDEQITTNNELAAFLRVLEGGVRVLYLDGNPAWQEQKFIRRAMDAAPDVDLDYVWVDRRNQAKWPIDLAAMLERQRYDVVLIGDLHSMALGAASAKELAKRVDQGMGWMLLGGAHSFGPGGYGRFAELAAALPVKLSEYEVRPLNAGLDPQQHVTMDLRGQPVEHFVTRLGPTAVDRWRDMPPFAGANLIKPTPVGRVLVTGRPVDAAGTSDEYPLLIAGEYGRGRVLAFAVDSTFRWFRHGYVDEHARFWRQAMLWLARKDQSDANQVWIDLTPRRWPSGSQIEFQTGVRDAEGKTISDAVLSAVIEPQGNLEDVDGESPAPAPPESCEMMRTADGWRGKSLPQRQAGEYRLTVRAERNGELLGTAVARFLITMQDLEMTDPAANPQQLAQLASLTSEAGGREVALEQSSDLIEEITQHRKEQRVRIEQRWRLGDTALDAWLVFLLVVGLLSVEWFLRKRWSLA